MTVKVKVLIESRLLKSEFRLNCDYQSQDFDPRPQDNVASQVY